MTRTRLTLLLFILASVCAIAPAANGQTPVNITLTLDSGSVAVTAYNGVSGFSGSGGLSLGFASVTTSDGTNYTDTNGALSFTDSGGNAYSGIPVSGVTVQSGTSGYDYEEEVVGYYQVYEGYYVESCGFACTEDVPIYDYFPEYEDETVGNYGNFTDSVTGTITPGTSIEIGGQPYVIADGSFTFDYQNSYQNGAYGNYNDNYFNGGSIDLTADEADPPAPEPGTYLTMGTGLIFLLGVARRKLLVSST